MLLGTIEQADIHRTVILRIDRYMHIIIIIRPFLVTPAQLALVETSPVHRVTSFITSRPVCVRS